MMYSELQTTLKDNSSNNGKGRLLEAPVKTILHNLDYTVDSHHITSGGLDIVATKGTETVIAECINWYGGYIHPKRFLSIIKNLAQPGTHKFLFCCGVYPTQEQFRVLDAMNVNIIHLEEQILRIDYRIIQQLRSQLLGVITTVNCTDCLVNKERKTVNKVGKSTKTEERNTCFECFRVRKTVPKQAYNWQKRFLEVYSRGEYEYLEKNILNKKVGPKEARIQRILSYVDDLEKMGILKSPNSIKNSTEYMKENQKRKHVIQCLKKRLSVGSYIYQPFERFRGNIDVYRAVQQYTLENRLVSVRQLYYFCISNGVLPFPKNGKEAKNTYNKLWNVTMRCREGGLIPLDSIVDTTELLGTPQSQNMVEPLLRTITNYRSKWWSEQPVYAEVWLEKNALKHIVAPVTNKFGVFLAVAGGYPTVSQIYNAKLRYENEYPEKEVVILYLGDLDPSGKDMCRALRANFEKYELKNEITIKEVALTKEDVERYNLIKNPFKQKETREEWYINKYGINYAVELDALEPEILAKKVENAILDISDLDSLSKSIEKDEEIKEDWTQFIQKKRGVKKI